MDKTTHEVRLAHWKQIVEQCQARPEGQTRVPAVQAQPAVSFVEIPFQPAGGSDAGCAFHPAAVIKVGNASVALSNDISAKLMSGIIREVSRHA